MPTIINKGPINKAKQCKKVNLSGKLFPKTMPVIDEAGLLPKGFWEKAAKKPAVDPREKVFMLTDGCMWEKNKQEGAGHAHAIEVVDAETGQVRYIKSGSRIKFVEGNITEARNMSDYLSYQNKNANNRS